MTQPTDTTTGKPSRDVVADFWRRFSEADTDDEKLAMIAEAETLGVVERGVVERGSVYERAMIDGYNQGDSEADKLWLAQSLGYKIAITDEHLPSAADEPQTPSLKLDGAFRWALQFRRHIPGQQERQIESLHGEGVGHWAGLTAEVNVDAGTHLEVRVLGLPDGCDPAPVGVDVASSGSAHERQTLALEISDAVANVIVKQRRDAVSTPNAPLQD